MKKRNLAAIGRDLAVHLPHFCSQGTMIFETPVGSLLRGIHFGNSSIANDAFYMHVCFQPLFVPFSYVHFSFGYRVSSGENDLWRSSMPDMMSRLEKAVALDAEPFLRSVKDVEGAARYLEQRRSPNPNFVEALAYCQVLLGNTRAAEAMIMPLIPRLNMDIAWNKAIAERVTLIAEYLRTDPAKATAQLREWEGVTRVALQIEAD